MNKINRIITLDSLLSVPSPETTSTYKVITHKNLDELTREALENNNFELQSTTYLSANHGQEAIGRYNIKFGNDPDMGLMIAWQNSYDKKVTVKFAIGGHVFVCSNGVVVGDMGAFRHKHVGDVQQVTPSTINEFISHTGDIFDQMVYDKEEMKLISTTRRQCSELLGRMFIDNQIITANQLGIIKRQIDSPDFDYGTTDTVWNLMNNITFALKEAHPKNWMQQHIDAYQFLKQEFNI